MNKIILIFSILIGSLVVNSSLSVKAQSETTFPVDEAGIAAYVKLDNIDITVLTDALSHLSGDKRQGINYVIGQKNIENIREYNHPYIYVGLDGWMVAYYLRTEEASKIMQWKGYVQGSIQTTTLKDAIDALCAEIGVTYSMPIKYYDFEFPDANKMILVAEAARSGGNNFSITVPGTIYEASYSAYGNVDYPCSWGSCGGTVYLKLDGNQVFPWISNQSPLIYGYYTNFLPNTPHYIELYDNYDWTFGATVVIYKN